MAHVAGIRTGVLVALPEPLLHLYGGVAAVKLNFVLPDRANPSSLVSKNVHLFGGLFYCFENGIRTTKPSRLWPPFTFD